MSRQSRRRRGSRCRKSGRNDGGNHRAGDIPQRRRSSPSRKTHTTSSASSHITQLRTGHIPLNAYLHRRKLRNSPICTTCRTPETVDHFLIIRKRFVAQRAVLRTSIKGPLRPSNLLGTATNLHMTARFVRDTKRFTSQPDRQNT